MKNECSVPRTHFASNNENIKARNAPGFESKTRRLLVESIKYPNREDVLLRLRKESFRCDCSYPRLAKAKRKTEAYAALVAEEAAKEAERIAIAQLGVGSAVTGSDKL